jgi:ribonucleoside-diphosphate reductase alpha chain
MPNFITEQGRTNWKKLEDTIRLAVRFLDNVIDINNYPITEIDIVAHNARRIGLGLMGWAEWFFAKKVRYGSPDAVIEIERFMKFFRDTIYTVLIELSVEKGSFPMFEPIAYGKASFIRKLPASLRKEIKSKGVRCCTAITQPPAGTTSLLPEVTSGCEPLYAKAYKRKDRVSERIYIHPIYQNLITQGNLIENKELPNWFVDTFDLTPKDHLETQATLQRYLDNSISKTLNLPKGTTVGQLSDWLLEYLYDLKGVTVYVDGSREGQVLNHISHEEAVKIVLEGKDTTDVPEEQKCKSGVCEV